MKKKTFLCIIPARGGSKGIINKNIIDINGSPLISYSIKLAIHSKIFDRVVVSTDSQEIAIIAKFYGAEVPFLRPCHLATDNSKVEDAIAYTLQRIEKYDYVCLLQPTSPLVDLIDIKNAKQLLFDREADMIVSVSISPINIAWTRYISEDLSMKNFTENICSTNRQCFKNMYYLNGAIYLGKWSIFYNKKNYYKQNTYAYIMSYEKSIDIDSLLDIKLVEFFLKYNKLKK